MSANPAGFTLREIITTARESLRGNWLLAWKALACYLGVEILLAGFFMLLAPSGTNDRVFGFPNPPGLLDELAQSVALLPMFAGLWMFGVALSRGHSPSPFSIFSWYDQTLKLLLVTILSHLMILLGTLALVIPGIYLLVSYQFAIPLAVDKGLGPWEAMERSRKMVSSCWFKVFALTLLALLSLAGSVLLAGIPLIWVLPMLMQTWAILYDRLAGIEDASISRSLKPFRRRSMRRSRGSRGETP